MHENFTFRKVFQKYICENWIWYRMSLVVFSNALENVTDVSFVFWGIPVEVLRCFYLLMSIFCSVFGIRDAKIIKIFE